MWLNEPMNDPSDFGIFFDKVSYQIENYDEHALQDPTRPMMGQCRYGRYGRYGRQHPTAEVFRELPADMIFLGSGLEFVPKRKGAGREAVRTFTDPDPMQEKKYHKTSN